MPAGVGAETVSADRRLDAAIIAVLASDVPGASRADIADLVTVTRLAPSARSWRTSSGRVRVTTALVLALARQGQARSAVTLLEEDLPTLLSDEGVDDGAVIDLLSAAAEASVSMGDVREAASRAAQALSFATRLNDDRKTFRAGALLAVSRALNGEYGPAARDASACRTLQLAHAWVDGPYAYPLLLAEILLASARLDEPALRRLADVLRDVDPDDALWVATSRATEAMALLVTGDAPRAIALLHLVVGGTDSRGILPMIRGFALGVYADVLLCNGEARRALDLLDGQESPPGHALCFDMQRSAAHLLLGDGQAALLTTDGCSALGARHCLRTLVPVLLRRAIGYEMLGREALADERFAEAAHSLLLSGSSTPFLTLPPQHLLVLLARFERRHAAPEGVADLRARILQLPAVDVRRPALPRLTPRETRLAGELRTGSTLAEIAAGHHLSVNTIKAQTRSLYRKLGVSSRDQAVRTLQEGGFYYRPDAGEIRG